MGRELRCAASVAAALLLMTAMVARATDPLANGDRVEWRMELIELVAVRTVYNLFCKANISSTCDISHKMKISALRHWAGRDTGWERLVASVSLSQLGHQLLSVSDYQHALAAADQALALKLYPYEDPSLSLRWQQSLVRPGYLFQRPKAELVDILALRAGCLLGLGKRDRSLDHLRQAMDAIYLAAAVSHSTMVRPPPASTFDILQLAPTSPAPSSVTRASN
ncbi:hypothetical protein V8C86DRAFT_2536998 [Haematococcus lacustris]